MPENRKLVVTQVIPTPKEVSFSIHSDLLKVISKQEPIPAKVIYNK